MKINLKNGFMDTIKPYEPSRKFETVEEFFKYYSE